MHCAHETTMIFVPMSATKLNLNGSWDHLCNTKEDNLQYILTRFVLSDSLCHIPAKTNVKPWGGCKLFGCCLSFLINFLYVSFLAGKKTTKKKTKAKIQLCGFRIWPLVHSGVHVSYSARIISSGIITSERHDGNMLILYILKDKKKHLRDCFTYFFLMCLSFTFSIARECF